MNDLTVTGIAIAQEVLRRVAGEFAAAFTNKMHRPIRVVLTAIDHAGQIAQQGREHTLVFAQRRHDADAVGDVMDD